MISKIRVIWAKIRDFLDSGRGHAVTLVAIWGLMLAFLPAWLLLALFTVVVLVVAGMCWAID